MKLVLLGLGFLCVLAHVSGHGRLVWPPGRTTAFRLEQFSSQIPWDKRYYNDNEQNCGGRWNQHDVQGGKCGECGDDFGATRPRPFESGGEWDSGIIVDSYRMGEVIDVQVNLTKNHLGYFEFRLCAEHAAGIPEEQSCLDKHLLEAREHNGQPVRDTKVYIPKPLDPDPFAVDVHVMKYKLPEGVSCSHCVLQWHYHVGNSDGQCDDGSWGLGCGPQETFRACADIAIR